ncbi:hypothetical protein [Streptococcus iners]|uniref:RiboL-PSP-HEPN domain-containing protein n=1 Tax=Streptococcus iners subsp. hyiners TaxID=3028083 RepID=A0AA97A2U6_9STRE|nr:hypothetical protein [Streptococcus sp. 29892]MCK4029472.1 hypothetical protein [Streptococcus suis]WNY49130.1 hypothetical protein PW220_00285 [Streptococcus sp. 29892]
MNSFILSDNFYKNINKFKDIIDVVEQKNFMKETLQKNFIITLYTIWENESKGILFDHLEEKNEIIFDNNFTAVFYKTILNSTQYVKEEYIKSIANWELSIKKDYYFASNNLWFNNLIDLIKRLYPEASSEELLKMSNSFPRMQRCIENLETGSISKYSKKGENPNGFEGYIDSLVDKRNSLAHSGECDEYVNIDNMGEFFHFIDCALILVYQYLNNLYVKRLINGKILVKLKNIYEIAFPEATARVDFNSEQVDFMNEYKILKSKWFINNNGEYPIEILEIRDEVRQTISELPSNGHVILRIKSESIQFEEEKEYNLYNLSGHTDISNVFLESDFEKDGIIEVNFDLNQVNLWNNNTNDDFAKHWYIEHDELIYPIEILEIRNEESQTISELPPNGHVTLKIKSEYIDVKRNKKYKIFNLYYFDRLENIHTEKSLLFKI